VTVPHDYNDWRQIFWHFSNFLCFTWTLTTVERYLRHNLLALYKIVFLIDWSILYKQLSHKLRGSTVGHPIDSCLVCFTSNHRDLQACDKSAVTNYCQILCLLFTNTTFLARILLFYICVLLCHGWSKILTKPRPKKRPNMCASLKCCICSSKTKK